jgi:hypothetical protein
VTGLAAFALLATAAAAHAQGELPVAVQAALLDKVFLFDPALGSGTRVLLVFPDDATEPAAQRLLAAFQAAGLVAEAARTDAAGARIAAAGAVYFLAGADDESLRALCVQHKRLSVAGSSTLAEQGRVAVAVGVSTAGNPEIVVNRGRLEEEGHRLEPRVLRLARLVG